MINSKILIRSKSQNNLFFPYPRNYYEDVNFRQLQSFYSFILYSYIQPSYWFLLHFIIISIVITRTFNSNKLLLNIYFEKKLNIPDPTRIFKEILKVSI